MSEDYLIEQILKHLDDETRMGVARMSVEMDENSDTQVEVSHKCCRMYGKPANVIVGLLDGYTDTSAGRPDNEEREKRRMKQ